MEIGELGRFYPRKVLLVFGGLIAFSLYPQGSGLFQRLRGWLLELSPKERQAKMMFQEAQDLLLRGKTDLAIRNLEESLLLSSRREKEKKRLLAQAYFRRAKELARKKEYFIWKYLSVVSDFYTK